MADADIAETLARIEHKIDNLTRLVTGDRQLLPPQLGEPAICPTCKKQVSYFPDPIKKIVMRRCGCKTGIVPLDLSPYAPPGMAAVPDYLRKGETDGPDQEDGRNPHDRRGPGRR